LRLLVCGNFSLYPEGESPEKGDKKQHSGKSGIDERPEKGDEGWGSAGYEDDKKHDKQATAAAGLFMALILHYLTTE
jgi:hypothetical protein